MIHQAAKSSGCREDVLGINLSQDVAPTGLEDIVIKDRPQLHSHLDRSGVGLRLLPYVGAAEQEE